MKHIKACKRALAMKAASITVAAPAGPAPTSSTLAPVAGRVFPVRRTFGAPMPTAASEDEPSIPLRHVCPCCAEMDATEEDSREDPDHAAKRHASITDELTVLKVMTD